MTAPLTLTTGWEPDLPDADSLCLRWLRHWSDQVAAFADAAGGTVVRDERMVLADHGRPASFLDSVVLLAPPRGPGELDDLLDEVEARTAGGTGDLYLWSLWPTPDLHHRGWVLDGHPPLMARPPAPAPDLHPSEEPDPVTTPAALVEWERVVVDGYPEPALQPFRPGALAGPALLDDERFRFWTTAEDGRACSASVRFVAHGLASFALGVTLPGARRRGHWWRHARVRLHERPDLWHVGVFSDDSRPGAERLGFVPLLRHALWHRSR